MKTLLAIIILFSGISVGSHAQTRSENLFYMVNTPESFESFRANVFQISIVCPQTFLVSKEGVLSGSVDLRVLALAKANQVKVMPFIVNKGFDQKLLHDIVSNPVVRERSIEMICLTLERRCNSK